jgi:hypothetical protein
LIDPVLPYIDWAITNGFGVLDVNIPSHLTDDNDISSYHPKMTEAELNNQMKDLFCYLWDNYLEGYASNYIVLMGVGDAYLGVKQLLTSRGMFSFVSSRLFSSSRPVFHQIPIAILPPVEFQLTLPTQIAAIKSPQSSPSSPAPYAP